MSHHPTVEEIVDILCFKTQNTDRTFFRIEVAYFISKMASAMRAAVFTKDRGEIPINQYAIALANSGYGKGHSIYMMEELLKDFKTDFLENTFLNITQDSLSQRAHARAAKRATDPLEELAFLEKEFAEYGTYPFTFDSGTVPAIKQLRTMLLYSGIGSINLQLDEVGSNLMNSSEILNTFLELYDQGIIKPKLVKNTKENRRAEDLEGKTPANILLFGTPAKVFDGGQTENLFYSMLETGYARRCLFAYGNQAKKALHEQTAEEIYANLIKDSNDATLQKWSKHFKFLTSLAQFKRRIVLEDEQAINLLKYKLACEKEADALPDHKEIEKAELRHRYFKALKLAGAYAFIDMEKFISQENLDRAIFLVEESGQAFKKILDRDPPYVKLAKYLSSAETELTHADLHEALPFYKSSQSARNDMMQLAMAWGIKNHIVIKKSYEDGIEFFTGETLQETNLDQIILSASQDFASGYEPFKAPWSKLDNLIKSPDMHWCNHTFQHKHRKEENAIKGFNLVVLDIDGGTRLDSVHELLKEYEFITYTTKRHEPENHRFRLLIPTSHILDLDSKDYTAFMKNLLLWLPIKVDEATFQRSRKWLTNPSAVIYRNQGELLDILSFIPKTDKNQRYLEDMKKIENMDNLERWFAQKMQVGERNNNLLRYALLLKDQGMDYVTVENQVKAFNKKLSNPLSEDELDQTIFKTLASKYAVQ